jgi:REP element-mobilizing transposase RayT
MSYNPSLHNRHSIRLQGYDYSQSGAYFITICTDKKKKYFGDIVNGDVKLNLVGQYAFHQWKLIPQRFTNVELDEFIIMPNHIHGIIVIRSGSGEGSDNEVMDGKQRLFSDPSPIHVHEKIHPNGTYPGSIGAIVQNFKSSTSRKINAMPKMKGITIWQKNYYDHIIRNEEDYARIVEYIRINPQKWEQDELFENGL